MLRNEIVSKIEEIVKAYLEELTKNSDMRFLGRDEPDYHKELLRRVDEGILEIDPIYLIHDYNARRFLVHKTAIDAFYQHLRKKLGLENIQ